MFSLLHFLCVPGNPFVFSADLASCFAFFALKISQQIFNAEYAKEDAEFAEAMRPKDSRRGTRSLSLAVLTYASQAFYFKDQCPGLSAAN